MKGLCIDARMIGSSGIGTYLNHLIPFFAAHFETILIGERKKLEKYSCEILEGDCPIFSLQEQIFLPKIIPAVDLFFSPHYNTPFFPIKAQKRAVTIHDLYPLSFKGHLNFFKRRCAYVLLKNGKFRADVLMTVSEFSKREIHQWLGPGIVHVAPLGVSQDIFSPELQSGDESIFLKYGIDKKFLLFVGNSKPHKNLQALKKALSTLKDPISLFALENQNISQKDLSALYRSAVGFVFPSLYEGFGLPPLEAMASGCPVLASNKGSIPEVLGKAALYFDPQNSEDFENKLNYFLKNEALRKNLSKKGIEHSKSFSWKKTAEKHIEAYEDCLGA